MVGGPARVARCESERERERAPRGEREESHREESFETGLLEPSLYTHPRNWNGIEAPEILASGHHQKIAEWRLEEAKKETRTRRPDLWQRYLQGQGPDNKAKE